MRFGRDRATPPAASEPLHVVFDSPLQLNINLTIRSVLPAVGTRIVLTGGSPMPGEITIDEANEVARFEFVDRINERTDPPAGAVVTWSSDNEAIATVAQSADDPLSAKVTPVSAGTCNIVGAVSGATEPDGTPFPNASASLKVDPGAAVGDRVVLSV